MAFPVRRPSNPLIIAPLPLIEALRVGPWKHDSTIRDLTTAMVTSEGWSSLCRTGRAAVRASEQSAVVITARRWAPGFVLIFMRR